MEKLFRRVRVFCSRWTASLCQMEVSQTIWVHGGRGQLQSRRRSTGTWKPLLLRHDEADCSWSALVLGSGSQRVTEAHHRCDRKFIHCCSVSSQDMSGPPDSQLNCLKNVCRASAAHVKLMVFVCHPSLHWDTVKKLTWRTDVRSQDTLQLKHWPFTEALVVEPCPIFIDSIFVFLFFSSNLWRSLSKV